MAAQATVINVATAVDAATAEGSSTAVENATATVESAAHTEQQATDELQSNRNNPTAIQGLASSLGSDASKLSAATATAAIIAAEFPGTEEAAPIFAEVSIESGAVATIADGIDHKNVSTILDGTSTLLGGAGLLVDDAAEDVELDRDSAAMLRTIGMALDYSSALGADAGVFVYGYGW